jgi:hypothetical protein
MMTAPGTDSESAGYGHDEFGRMMHLPGAAHSVVPRTDADRPEFVVERRKKGEAIVRDDRDET